MGVGVQVPLVGMDLLSPTSWEDWVQGRLTAEMGLMVKGLEAQGPQVPYSVSTTSATLQAEIAHRVQMVVTGGRKAVLVDQVREELQEEQQGCLVLLGGLLGGERKELLVPTVHLVLVELERMELQDS